MSGAVFTLGNSVSGSLSLGSALSKFGRVAGQAGFTIEQEEETLNNTVTSRYAGLAAVTVSGVTSVLNPSLVLIPSAYNTSGSTGILYSLHSKPNGVADFVVTRATEGTRFNSVGRISSVGSGDARLDYLTSGGTVGPPALLVEPSAQNVVVQSQNWLASGWRDDATSNVTTVSSTTGTIDPLGTNTANAISPTSGNTTHLKVGSDASIIFASGTIYTSSAFFKQGTGNAGRYVQVTFPTVQFGQLGYANFDLQLGTVAVVSGTSADANRAASIENYGNGWYRCRLTSTCNSAGTSNGISIALIETSGATRLPTFTGTTTNVIYGWGAQTETGSVATSYIPTTAAPVTRNADVISVSGAVSGCIGQTEGTIYWDIAYVGGVLTGTGNPEFGVRNQALTNWIALTSNGPSAPFRINARTTGGVSLINYTANITSGKAALAWSSAGLVLYVNGVSVATSATNPNFSFSRADIGNTSTMPFKANAFALYTTRLTDTELAALTTL